MTDKVLEVLEIYEKMKRIKSLMDELYDRRANEELREYYADMYAELDKRFNTLIK